MKRNIAIKSLDDAAGDAIGNAFRVLVSNIAGREPEAADKFHSMVTIILRAYATAQEKIVLSCPD